MGNSYNPVMPDVEGLQSISIGTCVGASVSALSDYDATEKECSFRSFRKHFTRGQFNALSDDFNYEIDPRSGLTLQDDWAVSYGWGYYLGQKVVCMHRSSIHNFYLAKTGK